MNHFDIIQRPLITEKGTRTQEFSNQYFFAVNPGASKIEIRHAVQRIFGVKVTAVRTMNIGGKKRRVGKSVGRTAAWKKAIVTLKKDDRIEFMEGA